ncbi:hypothetical protein CC56_2109 [Bordetella pertussis H934]|nr:hypothetical protein CC56_2109 [Bordetella pertussis H934]
MHATGKNAKRPDGRFADKQGSSCRAPGNARAAAMAWRA